MSLDGCASKLRKDRCLELGVYHKKPPLFVWRLMTGVQQLLRQDVLQQISRRVARFLYAHHVCGDGNIVRQLRQPRIGHPSIATPSTE